MSQDDRTNEQKRSQTERVLERALERDLDDPLAELARLIDESDPIMEPSPMQNGRDFLGAYVPKPRDAFFRRDLPRFPLLRGWHASR